LSEWHLDPVYISEHWTDEMFGVMVEKLVERKQRINEAMSGKGHSGDRVVSDKALFQQLGNKLKVVKRGD